MKRKLDPQGESPCNMITMIIVLILPSLLQRDLSFTQVNAVSEKKSCGNNNSPCKDVQVLIPGTYDHYAVCQGELNLQMGLPWCPVVRSLPDDAGHLGLIPGLGRL